jgi:hypothetical protein
MTRLLNAWGALGRNQRLAAGVSLALFVSMLLPWYSKTTTVVVKGTASSTEQHLSAFGAFSFVEAAALLVSVGVLAMLFARAERRDFQLPGGDGLIVTIAGAWVAILIFYRLFDKPGLQGNQKFVSTVGLQWGIFIALLLALGLAYAGRLIRAGERGAPPLSRADRPAPDPATRPAYEAREEDATEGIALAPAPTTPAARQARRGERPRYPPAPAEQMSFEEEPPPES